MQRPLAFAAIALTVAACSPAPQNQSAEQPAAPAATAPAPEAATSEKVIGLEGLGDLRLGQTPPARWAELGAQASDTCRTVSSPDYPGVYAIVTEGKVQRITVGQASDLKLAEGVGVGSTEQEVRSWFGGFREEPHKYVDKPAKYLTAPNADSGEAALRFEIGQDGKVSLIHIGVMPVLGYVEGCA